MVVFIKRTRSCFIKQSSPRWNHMDNLIHSVSSFHLIRFELNILCLVSNLYLTIRRVPLEHTEKEANNGTLTFITSLHFSHYSKQ